MEVLQVFFAMWGAWPFRSAQGQTNPVTLMLGGALGGVALVPSAGGAAAVAPSSRCLCTQ